MIPAAYRRPTIPTSRRDLEMLRIAPIDAAPLPRVHATPHQSAGTIRVLDRAAGVEVIVYSPTFRSQFECGHRAGRWYVRETTSAGGPPQSVGFATAREAVDAVAADSWRLRVFSADEPSNASSGRTRLRVYWGPTERRA